VLIPLLFMQDGWAAFPGVCVTLSVTILVSAVVSLTLTPIVSARSCATKKMRIKIGFTGLGKSLQLDYRSAIR